MISKQIENLISKQRELLIRKQKLFNLFRETSEQSLVLNLPLAVLNMIKTESQVLNVTRNKIISEDDLDNSIKDDIRDSASKHLIESVQRFLSAWLR